MKDIPWFKVVGGIILFASWIAQNYFTSERNSELAYLNNTQSLISIEEGHFTQWYILYFKEKNSENPNAEIIMNSAFKAAQHQLNILTWASARVTDPKAHESLLEEKRSLKEQMDIALNSGESALAEQYLNAVVSAANNIGPSLIAAHNDRYHTARSKGSIWNSTFLILYLIGSIVLGIGFIVSWRSNNKVHNKCRQPTAKSVT